VKTLKDIVNYLKDVQIEMKKVVWPKRQEVIRLTFVVFIISGIVAAYVGVLDYVLTKSLQFLVSK
jgi:preprotein translocase subunit SecE